MSNLPSVRKTVVSDLRRRIARRELSPGERLPSRNVLAEQYGVSHFTIVGALAELSALGFVSTRPRSGVYVEHETSHAAGERNRASAGSSKLVAATVAVIGLMPFIPDSEHLRRRSGWQAAAIVGVFDEMKARRLHPLVLDPSSIDDETLENISHNAGGAVITDVCPPAIAKMCVEAFNRCGMNFVSGNPATLGTDCNQIRYNFERGGYLLAKWLFGTGRRRIAPIWYSHGDDYWLHERHAGYIAAAREYGVVPLDPVIVDEGEISGPSASDVRARIAAGYIADLMCNGPKPDALLLPSDGLATDFARALRMNGLEPNVDVALAGYDNYWIDMPEQWRSGGVCPIVTIDKQNLAFGAELIRLLEERKVSDPAANAEVRVIEPILIAADGTK